MSFQAVFFDRDNTLNYDPGYLGDVDLVKLYDGVGEGIYKLKNNYNFKIVVISNQSGITRGLISHKQVDDVNNRINEILKNNFNVEIDSFYYCPFHPNFDTIEQTKCRKPSPELVFLAANELNIDIKKSYFVGDSISDIECGINAGTKTILLDYNSDEKKRILLKKRNKTPNFTTEFFLNATDFIISDFTGGKTFAN